MGGNVNDVIFVALIMGVYAGSDFHFAVILYVFGRIARVSLFCCLNVVKCA